MTMDTQAIGAGDSAAGRSADPSARLEPWKQLLPLLLVGGVLAWAYAPNLFDLVETWEKDPNYSHGFLVLPIALVVLWRRWPEFRFSDARPSRLGWALVVGSLVVRALAYERGSYWIESFTILPALTGLTLAYGGWAALRYAWPAIAFLVFMLPLPKIVNEFMAMPLQTLASIASAFVLRQTGLWVMRDGNVIVVGGETLEVAEACNGLSMLLSLTATIVTTLLLIPMTTWKRVILLLSIIPIALLSNILRIAATAWCYHLYGAEVGSKYAHDMAGWMMMPTALVFVLLELKFLSWIVIEEQEEEILPLLNPKYRPPNA